MRKSIKKVAATLLAATMTLGTLTSAFAYETGTKQEKDKDGNVTYEYEAVTDVDDKEAVYFAVGNMSPEAWKTDATANIIKPVDGLDGVYSIDLTFPAYDDESKWASRFGICAAYYDESTGVFTAGTWARMLVGEPAYTANDGLTCLSNISVRPEEELKTTVYYDERTATVYIQDEEGNAVDYYLSWVGNDDDEVYMTVADYAKTTYEDYYNGLSTDDRRADLDKIAKDITLTKSLFDGTYASNVEGLAAYVNGGDDYYKAEEPASEPASEPATEPATEATTTAAVVTPAASTPAAATPAATPAAATTAANQATKTGDVAPVALLAVLLASVAVVAVAAKKKEA